MLIAEDAVKNVRKFVFSSLPVNRAKHGIVQARGELVMVTMIVYSSAHYPSTWWTVLDTVDEVKRSYLVVNRR